MSDQHFKADAGKLRPSLLLFGMPRALTAVTAVLTYGAQKYEAHSWKNVDMARYEDALIRHQLDRIRGEVNDPESGLSHLAHQACNNLFLLEDYMAHLTPGAYRRALQFNPPPTEHKNAG